MAEAAVHCRAVTGVVVAPHLSACIAVGRRLPRQHQCVGEGALVVVRRLVVVVVVVVAVGVVGVVMGRGATMKVARCPTRSRL
jgi:hypothetical protein